MMYFSILLFAFVFEQPLSDSFIALGKVKPLFYYDLISVVGITGLLVIFPGDSLEDFALRRGLLGLGFTSLFFIYTERMVNLSYVYTFSPSANPDHVVACLAPRDPSAARVPVDGVAKSMSRCLQ